MNLLHEENYGDLVVCDDCNTDFTTSPCSGGIMFDSKAICPDCTPSWIEGARKYDETDHIHAVCPVGQSFADWVRKVIRGDKPALLRIYSGTDGIK